MTATTDSDSLPRRFFGLDRIPRRRPQGRRVRKVLGTEPLQLLVPAIVVYEVHKKLLVTNNEFALQRFISHAFHSIQVSLDFELAAVSAKASIDHRLAMADAMIYAIAQNLYGAKLVTADPDFRGLPGVILL